MRVAALTQDWARAMGVAAGEAERWERAALLHDALKDATPEEMTRWLPQGDWQLQLWHGPAAAAAAAAHGETDAGVLSAVRYHSVGWTGWDDCGPILFLADFLEPGRTAELEQRTAWRNRVPDDLPRVLAEVLHHRIARLETAGRPVRPETRELWNALARDASSS